MEPIDEFGFGMHYGDDTGVTFYGPPKNGFWFDSLDVSDRFADPLFEAILEKAFQKACQSGSDHMENAPRIAREWNTLQGWRGVGAGITELPPDDARDFALALAELTLADLPAGIAGATPDQCLRCAAAIHEFLTTRLASGLTVYID